MQEHEGGSAHFDRSSLTLVTLDGTELQFPYQYGNNLPFMMLDWDTYANQPSLNSARAFELQSDRTIIETNQTLHETNWNLSKPQKELMLWHNRLGHASF